MELKKAKLFSVPSFLDTIGNNKILYKIKETIEKSIVCFVLR